VIGLAGNKCDLNDKREVPTEESRQYAQENHLIFYEMSAKTGENVQNMFQHIAMRLPRQNNASHPADDIQLIAEEAGGKKRGGCC
jgi:GTPase SAR1 family protein